MSAPLSVADALRDGTRRLRSGGVDRSPRLDAELLLGAALGLERTALLRAPERALAPGERADYEAFLRRREAREPIAYIRGRRAFRTLELEVDRSVLIPRPETETLVDAALEALAGVAARPYGEEPRALDVGTGSGCIALALAAEDPYVHVSATDIDAAALAVARRNAARHGLEGRVDFVAGDLLAAVPPGLRFELVVSNPPYVTQAEWERLEPNVRDYEPRGALVGGVDGLEVYRRLVPGAAEVLRPGGVLALEIGVGQAAAVCELIAAAGRYGAPRVRPDLAGLPRVVVAGLEA